MAHYKDGTPAAIGDVVRLVAPSIEPALEEPTGPGELWCLVLWGERGRERAALVPVTPSARAPGPRGSA